MAENGGRLYQRDRASAKFASNRRRWSSKYDTTTNYKITPRDDSDTIIANDLSEKASDTDMDTASKRQTKTLKSNEPKTNLFVGYDPPYNDEHGNTPSSPDPALLGVKQKLFLFETMEKEKSMPGTLAKYKSKSSELLLASERRCVRKWEKNLQFSESKKMFRSTRNINDLTYYDNTKVNQEVDSPTKEAVKEICPTVVSKELTVPDVQTNLEEVETKLAQVAIVIPDYSEHVDPGILEDNETQPLKDTAADLATSEDFGEFTDYDGNDVDMDLKESSATEGNFQSRNESPLDKSKPWAEAINSKTYLTPAFIKYLGLDNEATIREDNDKSKVTRDINEEMREERNEQLNEEKVNEEDVNEEMNDNMNQEVNEELYDKAGVEENGEFGQEENEQHKIKDHINENDNETITAEDLTGSVNEAVSKHALKVELNDLLSKRQTPKFPNETTYLNTSSENIWRSSSLWREVSEPYDDMVNKSILTPNFSQYRNGGPDFSKQTEGENFKESVGEAKTTNISLQSQIEDQEQPIGRDSQGFSHSQVEDTSSHVNAVNAPDIPEVIENILPEVEEVDVRNVKAKTHLNVFNRNYRSLSKITASQALSLRGVKYNSLQPVNDAPSSEDPIDKLHKGYESIQPILQELIKTEETYVETLWTGLNNYGNLFERKDLPKGLKGKKYVLFANIEQIAEFHRDEFLPMLLRNRNDLKHLFDEFQQFIDENCFYAYVIYAINNQRSLDLCDLYKKYFKIIQAERNDNLGINSFLLQPIQRVARYPLLLKEFIKKLFDNYPLKATIDSCCRLDKKYQNLLTATNKSEVINDLMAIKETHEFNIFYQGKFRDVNELNVFDHTLKRSYRSKVFIYDKCIIYTEIKRKELLFRGRYPREHIGIESQHKFFTLYYDRRKQQECDFMGDPAVVKHCLDLINSILIGYAEEERARLKKLHSQQNGKEFMRRKTPNLVLFRDSNRFSVYSGFGNT